MSGTVPKSFMHGLIRLTTDPEEDPGQAWSPMTLEEGGETRTAPVVYNAFATGNNFNFARLRGNETPIILTEAARTATVDSELFLNINGNGAHFIINVASITGTPSITVKIQGKDPAKDGEPFRFYDILESNPITTTGINILKVYPGINSVPNGAAADIVPYEWRVRVEHADAQSITYSVGANLVV